MTRFRSFQRLNNIPAFNRLQTLDHVREQMTVIRDQKEVYCTKDERHKHTLDYPWVKVDNVDYQPKCL